MKHILVIGDYSSEQMTTFLQEFFHEDHGSTMTNIVICRNSEPSPEISLILNNPKFNQKITYIKGNCL